MDRGAWQAMVHRVTKSWTRLKRLHTHTHIQRIYINPNLPIYRHTQLSSLEAKTVEYKSYSKSNVESDLFSVMPATTIPLSSMNLTFLGTSCKWNHTAFVL